MFDDASGTWTVRVTRADGSLEERTCSAVISAVGQLNRPKLPDIEGRDDFVGPAFHSARWDASVDLAGKRVAVIGTGASAAQLIPAVAPEVDHLTVFQRTPNWLVPTPDYHDAVAPGMVWLLDTIPTYRSWYRLWVWWRSHEGLLSAAIVDPEWPDHERSVSAINELVRLLLLGYLQEQLGDRPDLLEASTPQYPPIAKRIIRDNGAWPGAIKRDNVSLVTEGIERITATGVATNDGVHHEVDVIVYGTGFHASKFLMPMKVIGRGGADLHDTWQGDARAYLGITVPGFPNLFCLYGPNTNIVINGSIIYFSELEVRYILGCLHLLAEGNHRWLDVKPAVHEAF
ncbi:MAG TPA: NAD(P)/FAD-dependent oxidoreductase, partial [Acidimicrobiales bacterium]|nr:NAD(P)/FAD-dependent oxidoreductase [Acidimicrobiales bacterium]